MLSFEKIPVDLARAEELKGLEELFRANVPGGWLVVLKQKFVEQVGGICFVPDPDHEWEVPPDGR